MDINVLILPQLATSRDLAEKNVVVMDVLRATSTVVTSFAHRASEIIPVVEPSEAIALARKIGTGGCILGGERKGFKIEGFNLGNSPFEYTEPVVAGKKIILCTTNGTKAIKTAQGAAEIIIGSFLNLSTVVNYLSNSERDLVLICSGREGNLSQEDLACAGFIVKQLLASVKKLSLTDAAKTALYVAERAEQRGLQKFISETDHGQYLKEVGMEQDLIACAEIDQFPILPRFAEGRISL